jgi:hypothetical protein
MSRAREAEYTPEQLDAFYERASRRGIVLRRQRRLVFVLTLIVLVIAVVVPLTALQLGRSPTPSITKSETGPYVDVAWRKVEYPGLNFRSTQYPHALGCGKHSTPLPTGEVLPVDVQQVSYIEPRHGPRLAIVLVRCLSGTPTPSSLYAFNGVGRGAHPRLFAVLLAPPSSGTASLWYATDFTTTRSRIAMTPKGVIGSAAICCPNVIAHMVWTWTGLSFSQSVTSYPYITSPVQPAGGN